MGKFGIAQGMSLYVIAQAEMYKRKCISREIQAELHKRKCKKYLTSINQHIMLCYRLYGT